MINEEKFKKEILQASKTVEINRFGMFYKDYLKVIHFYEESKTGNERRYRDRDTGYLTRTDRVLLISLSEKSEYLKSVANSDFNAWIVAQYLYEMKEKEEKIARKRGVI